MHDWARIATFAFTLLAVATKIATEVLRSIYDKKRVRETGFGGTQDINLVGVTVMIFWTICAVVTAIIWHSRHP